MKVTRTRIPDVAVVEPVVHGDARGHFFEAFPQAKLEAALGRPLRFVQDNQSRSARGVLRGLHYQLPHAQGKLVRVLSGEIFDVAVDARRGSPTFGRWVGEVLSAENRKQLWVPEGFAHGFLSLADATDVLYKITRPWHPEAEHCILWNDPDIGIDWPLGNSAPLVSPKDAQGKPFRATRVFEKGEW
jgi:dTDP-4-dehydrorhamnose 3,5-epimerase